MYVRFVSPMVDPDTRVEMGFFQTFSSLPTDFCQAWIRQEIREQISWYNKNLRVPKVLGKHFTRRTSIWGICWFKPEAAEHIERAHYCAWLLEEAGIPICKLKADIRKEIIWQDANQILSKPTKQTPRAFN